jgi:hypothetical protein
MTNFLNSVRLTALVAALTFLAGCGSMPTGPALDDSGARVATNGVEAQQAYTLPTDETVQPGGSGSATEPTPDDELPPVGGGGSTQNQGTMLTETLGGTVRGGRWRVEVPTGAVDGSARFLVTPTNAGGGIVNLAIFPVEKNHFDTPVRLVADCHGVPLQRLRTWFISWYNPATGGWERVPGSTVDSRKKTVSAPLNHFSTYMVGPEAGRAGW